MSKDVIFALLAKMRGPNNSKTKNTDNKFFEDFLSEAWKMFEFTDEPDLLSFEAFIIEVINCVLIPKSNRLSKKNYKVAMRRRDECLLAYGLLDGYPRTVNNDTRLSALEVQEQYLDENISDFIAITYSEPLLRDKYDKKKYQAKIKLMFSKDSARCREDIAEYLSKKENCQKSMTEGIKKFIKEDETGKKYIDYPKPCYTLENFPPKKITFPDSDSTNQAIGETPDDPKEEYISMEIPGSASERMPRKLIFGFVIVLIILCILLLALHGWTFGSKTEITDIYVFNDNISLAVGTEEELDIRVAPSTARVKKVQCISMNSELVIMDGCTAKAQKESEWQDDVNHEAKIIVQGGKSKPYNVTITVINPKLSSIKARDNLKNIE